MRYMNGFIEITLILRQSLVDFQKRRRPSARPIGHSNDNSDEQDFTSRKFGLEINCLSCVGYRIIRGYLFLFVEKTDFLSY